MRYQREIELIDGRRFKEKVNCNSIELKTNTPDGKLVFLVELDSHTHMNVPKHAILTETVFYDPERHD